jgi:hypothetical protein
MSAIPPKADIDERGCHVRFVPKADIPRLFRSPVPKPGLPLHNPATRRGGSRQNRLAAGLLRKES